MNNNSLSGTCKTAASVSGYCVTQTEPFEKVIKLNTRFINMTGLLFGVSTGLKLVSKQFKDAFEVLESIRVFGMAKLLTTPNAQGIYPLSANNKEWSWQKRMDRCFLVAHQSLKFVNGCNKWGLIELGNIAKVSIGYLPIWKLVQDSLLIPSCAFGAWDALIKLAVEKKKFDLASQKIEKWQTRARTVVDVLIGDRMEIAALKKKYSAKIEDLNTQTQFYSNEIEKLNSNQSAYSELPIEDKEKMLADYKVKAAKIAQKIHTKLPIWQRRLDEIAKGNYQQLATELASKDIDGKVKKWETVKWNTKLSFTKNMLALANAVAKITVVVLALTFAVFTTNFTAPLLFPILFFGIINDGCGLAKILVDKYIKPKPIPV